MITASAVSPKRRPRPHDPWPYGLHVQITLKRSHEKWLEKGLTVTKTISQFSVPIGQNTHTHTRTGPGLCLDHGFFMATRVSVVATPSTLNRLEEHTHGHRNLAKKLNIKMHLLTSNLLEMADICLSQPGISLAGRKG